VLGPLSLTLLISLSLFLYHRRRRRRLAAAAVDVLPGEKKDNLFNKPQLHADSLPPEKPIELSAGDPQPVAELPAREVVGSEMFASIPGTGAAGGDNAAASTSISTSTPPQKIKRKEIPSQTSQTSQTVI
jgi:hypothetical protein